mgnify:FL=1
MLNKLSANYPLVMRLFLVFVFGWFGINEIINPRYWSGYIPEMIREFLPIPILPLVQGHGAILTFLAICFLFRFKLRYTGVLAILVLLSIIGGLLQTNGFDEIVVRDIGILGLALSVWLYEIKK